MTVIPKQKRHFSDFGWLKTYWLFSFSGYYDPGNIQFGALRVFNDDIVAPGTGFPTHPHEEMEILTVVLTGEMTHADSMGNKSVIKAGDVQRMSAGTGLTHSEFNLGQEPVHFYQIWIFPDEMGLKPSYDQKNFHPSGWQGRLLALASGQGIPDTVNFHTDATIYRAALEKGQQLNIPTKEERRIFMYVTEGTLSVEGKNLRAGDQARIELTQGLFLKAQGPSDLILIDVPSCKGWGYDEKTLQGERVRRKVKPS